jgi:hypothetical protein
MPIVDLAFSDTPISHMPFFSGCRQNAVPSTVPPRSKYISFDDGALSFGGSSADCHPRSGIARSSSIAYEASHSPYACVRWTGMPVDLGFAGSVGLE